MATAKPIVWTNGRYGSEVGKVGGEVLFSLHTSTKRGDTSLTLRTELPWHGLNETVANAEDGKTLAAEMLRAFVAKVAL